MARCHIPVVAVSVPLGFTVQPRLVSKLSKKMVPLAGVVGVGVGGAGVLVAVGTGVFVAVGTGVLVDVGGGVLVAVGIGVLVAVGRGVLVAVGGGVLVAVGTAPTVQTSRLQPFRLPPS